MPSGHLILLLPFLLLLTSAHACERRWEIKKWLKGHQFGISGEAPVAARVRNQPQLRNRVEPLVDFMRVLFDTVDSRIQRNDSLACNLALNDWVFSAFNYVQSRQIGEYDKVCNSRIDGNEAVASEELSREFVEGAMDVIHDAKAAMFKALEGIEAIPSPNDQELNWTSGAVALRGWDLRRRGQQCTVETAHAYRVKDKLHLRAAATNQPVNAFVEDPRRQYIQEFIREDFKSSLSFCHPKYDHNISREDEGRPNVTSTTLLTAFGGKATLSSHGNMDFDSNPAIVEAMRLNEIAVDQAEDAITISNIAILALPMAMNLIPVAFLADLNTCATLWYIIFTDIFSALPFLIKGVELVQSAKVRRGEMVAFHVGNKTLGELEVWAAECSGDESFQTLGIVFVAIAVTAIVLGVLLELFAGLLMRRRRERIGREAEGPFGKAAFDATAYSLLGSAKDDEKDRRYSMEGDLYGLDQSMASRGLFLRFRKKVSDSSGRSEKERKASEKNERTTSEKNERKTSEKSERGAGGSRWKSRKSDEEAEQPGLGDDGLTGAERAEIIERNSSGKSSKGGSESGSLGAGTSLVPPERTLR